MDVLEYLRNVRMSSSCERCEEDDPSTLDFHHEDRGEKSFNITSVGVRGRRLEEVQAEMAKCIILCANCHRKHHAKEGYR
jgi:hypothetical protein